MEIITICVACKDDEYGEAIKEALVRNYDGFIVRLWDCNKSLDCDIILTDELSRNGSNCVYLTEKLSQGDSSNAMFYKYGNVRELAGKLLTVYSNRTGRKIVNRANRETKVFSVISAEGGTGCTTVSLALAQELIRFHGKKIMYISLETFPSTADYFQVNKDCGMREYVYHILKGNFERCSCIEDFVVKDDYGIETFRVFNERNPVLELRGEEFATLLGFLVDMNRYDFIIIDCGNGAYPVNRKAIGVSRKNIFLKSNGKRSEAYIAWLNGLCLMGEKEEFVRVLNKHVEAWEDDDWEKVVAIMGESVEQNVDKKSSQKPEYEKDVIKTIIYDPSLCLKEVTPWRISLDTDFGIDIRELAKEFLRQRN